MTSILGISALYHDSAAALLIGGEIVAAAQEERFSRKKHDAGFPENAIRYVLAEADINLSDLNHIVFYDKPFLKFERLLATYLSTVPKGFSSFKLAMPIWLKEKLFLKHILIKELKKIDPFFNDSGILFSEHHFSHAASAFYPSQFNEAVVLTIDGVGEYATTTVAIGKNENLKIVKEIHFPHSLGLLYSAFTYYLGFKVNSGEYKVMGLAPYGDPKYKNIILENIVDVKADGSFILDQKYFNYMSGLTMTNDLFSSLFGHKVRKPEENNLSQFHMDLAASIQAVTEEILLRITRNLYSEYKIENLCMAGGVALNCVANSKIFKKSGFKNIWIQPAAGDAGGALGCALGVWHKELGKKRNVTSKDSMKGAFLGPKFSNSSIEKELKHLGAKFDLLSDKQIINKTAKSISEGKAVGWFQGRMEFGPRALGARSILADPRSDRMQKMLNLKVKFRESFRPFAPSILREEVSNWFKLDYESPYMLLVAEVNDSLCYEMTEKEKLLFGIDKLNVKRSYIPAVTHVDYSARVQTVTKETNLMYYKLIEKFREITGTPLLVNTSFNVRGEPLVCSPKDAFRCFMGTHLDLLIIGNYFLDKKLQNKDHSEDYIHKYELD